MALPTIIWPLALIFFTTLAKRVETKRDPSTTLGMTAKSVIARPFAKAIQVSKFLATILAMTEKL
jgi:hypothetical protein